MYVGPCPRASPQKYPMMAVSSRKGHRALPADPEHSAEIRRHRSPGAARFGKSDSLSLEL
jgi:hypothetical protein